MKNFKRLLCLVLALLLCCSICACGKNSGESNTSITKTAEEMAKDAVKNRGFYEYIGTTIGGKEIKSSAPTITNVKQISETEYIISGKMIYTDIYGDKWTNTFDCSVTQNDSGKWSARAFEYTDKNWRKQ